MICPNCKSNQSDNAKFCENCGTPLSAEKKDDLIAQNNTVSQNSQNSQNLPWYLSMPFIIALLFLCLAPVSIVLYIIRLDKTKSMPEKRKATIKAGIIAFTVFILFGTIAAILTFEKSPEQELRDINAAITSSDYQKAEELINEAYSDGSVSNDIIYVKFELYEKQGLFDKAADALIEYCDRFGDKTTIPDKIISKINEIKGLCAPETAAKLDNVINDINTQKQAKADAETKAKAEAEEKAKQEAEANAKAEAEAKAKAEADAKEAKAEAEEKERILSYNTGTTYEMLVRTPDKYKGSKVSFEGTVLQVMEKSKEVVVRLNLTDEEEDIACHIPISKMGESRILEDDYLYVIGTFDGLEDYISILGSVTVPEITVYDYSSDPFFGYEDDNYVPSYAYNSEPTRKGQKFWEEKMNELEEIDQEEDSIDYSSLGSGEMFDTKNRFLGRYDALLNEVYQYLKANLPESKFNAIQQEEREWVKKKMAKEKLSEEAESRADRYQALSETVVMVRDRCCVLIDYIE